MNRIFYLSSVLSLCLIVACGGNEEPSGENQEPDILLKRQTGSTTSSEEETSAEEPEDNAMSNKGIGPVENVELGEIDQGLVSQGKEVFEKNCTACHKIEKRYIGPPIQGVTERRTPEWIMNMILNPTEMIQKDPLAKHLVTEYNGAVMADQNISREQARALLEYFRSLEE